MLLAAEIGSLLVTKQLLGEKLKYERLKKIQVFVQN